MIYFDNSSTTIIKPKEVGLAVNYAIDNFGNPSRSFYKNSITALTEVYETRKALAELVNLDDPLKIAFTSSATESLNLVISSLINREDHVITTVLEHNAVLRPLYNNGCELSFIDTDDNGVLKYDTIISEIKENTKYFICLHGSNVTGNIVDVYKIYDICKKYGIIFILDISQTLGSIETDSDMADILCFTGHKALFGPQGTGGIIVKENINFRIVKTGGTGSDSFAKTQNCCMPDIFEVGTLNSHSLYGLKKGVEFISKIGIETIHKKEILLTQTFFEALLNINGVRIYGDFSDSYRLPIVSLNIKDFPSYVIAEELYEKNNIATRAKAHCAPLIHKRFGTEKQGMVRFSFSYFNTLEEINICVDAIKKLAEI